MPPNAYDIVVVGSGPAGQKAAIQGAKAGKKVVLIEQEQGIGGNCVYRGTIPSKTLRETALQFERLKRSSEVLKDGCGSMSRCPCCCTAWMRW